MGAAAPGGSTYQLVPIDLQGWNSPRGYACLGDDPPPRLGLFSRDVVQGRSKHRTGGKQDGLSICATRRPLPAPRAAHSLDRQTGPRRCGVQYLLLPLLGFIFLPFATLIYVIVYTPGVGVIGFDWFWVILAVLLDISHWTASYTQRNQIPGVR